MREGRIAYFEDDSFYAGAVISAIEVFGENRHRVIAQADNLDGSLGILDQIASGDIDANIVLSDGNLSPGASGSDAREIMSRVEELGLNVRTIILSGQSAEEIGVDVDASLLKRDRRVGSKLIEIMDAMDDPQKDFEQQ